MSDFKVIETQEQLDAILGDRVRRVKEADEKNMKPIHLLKTCRR